MPIAGNPKRLIRWLITSAVAALTITGLAAGDAESPAGGAGRQVTVVGAGEVQGSPDTLTIDVGIEFVAPDVATAMNQTNERQHFLIDALTEAGVDETDINTTQVSLQPQYTSEPGVPAAITAYRARTIRSWCATRGPERLTTPRIAPNSTRSCPGSSWAT